MSNKKIIPSGSSVFRISAQIIGTLITISALVFAIQRTWAIGQSNWEKLLNKEVFLVILVGGTIYGFSEFLLGWAWQKLLVWFGEPAKFRLCNAIYGRTQIAKYIPGNFFHLPTRHLMGNRVGFKHPALAGAAIYEIIGLVTASGMITLIGFPSKETVLGNSIASPLMIIFLFFLIPLAIQFFISHFKIGRKLGLPRMSISNAFIHLLPVWTAYLTFYTLAGGILWLIVGVTTGMWLSIPIRFILSAFAISWLVGFITPGAPAGLGVREATMILILSNFIGEPASILVTIISRLVITIGDIEYFALSHLYKLESISKNIEYEKV